MTDSLARIGLIMMEILKIFNNIEKEFELFGHCTPIMGQGKTPLMRPVFCNLQETGHLISVEF